MKNTRLLLLALAPQLVVVSNASGQAQSFGDFVKPTLDIRARYEYGSIDGLQDSNAATTRARLGLQSKVFGGFSGLIDGEFTEALYDDYSGGANGATPYDPTKTPIGDPETAEVNQAYLQYDNFQTMFRVGRQRIKYDNDAFIGNVIWRQNEQTYDAFTIENKSVAGLTFNYNYINGVNRIFGSDALNSNPAPAYARSSYDTDTHLIHANYKGIKGLDLTGYAYIMNFEDIPAYDNNTFGMIAKKDMFGLTFYNEIAFQDKAGRLANEDALYVHSTVTKNIGTQAITLGCEFLESGLKTPFATLHAFNGFADTLIGQRASGNHNGLTDTYITHSMPIFYGMKWINTVHIMGDNELSAGYGWEYDSVLSKKFNDNMTGIAKLGWFKSEGDGFNNNNNAILPDTTRFSVELNYAF